MFGWFERQLNPYPSAPSGQPPQKMLAFCWHYSKEAAPWLALMSFLTALIAVGEVFLFAFLGDIVNWLSHSSRETFLAEEGNRLFWMGALVLIGLPLVVWAQSLVMHQTLIGNYPMIGRWQMHRYLLRHSLSFFADEFAGRVATRVMQTSLAVREAVMKVLDVLVFVVVFFITMLIMVAATDIRLAVPLVVWSAIYIGMVMYFVPRMKRISREQADARSMMTGRVVDSYTNIATVKLFSHAGREEGYARAAMSDFLDTVHRQMRLVTLFHGIVYTNNALLLFVMATMSINFWLADSVSVGAIAASMALALRVSSMSHWIMWEVSALFENIGVVIDGMSMLSKPHQVNDARPDTHLQASKGKIAFEHIRFHYGKDGGVINDLSLTIEPGEKIGLVGRSGAGKTTLTNVLLRFYDLEAGQILIDGQDVSEVTQDSLRAKIGVVTQDTSLLHRSIRDNIGYSKPDATDEEIIDAAKRANAWDFIPELVDQKGRTGLDAHVGERGVKLSGGQRQRIAIARVFLKDAPILVLDEATSALDSEVEAAIQENLFALMEGKTVIAIAHRLSTIAEMDRLVVLDAGDIVETGTHTELVRAKGLYADLWSRQSGGFIDSDPQDKDAAAAE
ncbi:ABC transporter ATP-binding protein [Hoeflea poritis]|uniref:ABC transporter ATP-binding protein n=1 Tax=Hoeflea poritis TaxID=2993659 RepID=A0ABT4VTM6_9HYPH|nr:ABC transporter ATP-binding protein [Hoeflea poritis]MDA4847343.1 ABC transporter ATP-binding protein [Hoeflea poritis]